jgi:hypothetical protein
MNAPAPRFALALAMAAALGVGACSRAHITASHGRAFREIFAIQDANANRNKPPKSINGLDSQEAAIIAGSYRKGLAPKVDVAPNSGQLLMVNPNANGGSQAAVLAPSVPPGN